MIRPTRMALLLCGAGVLLATLPSILDERFWVAWLVYMLIFFAATTLDVLASPSANTLRSELEIPSTMFIGTGETMVVSFTCSGQRPLDVEVLFDLSEDLRPQPSVRVEVVPGERAIAEVTLVARRRGTVAVERMWIRRRGLWRLTSLVFSKPIGRDIAVVPNTRAVRDAALRFVVNREFLSGARTQKFVGDGSEFDALREYVPGLDHRAIDWKASARHRKLLSREYRAERNHQVVIAFDTGHLMGEALEGLPRLDYAINAGLLLSYGALRSGDRVSLFAFDDQVRLFTDPQGGVGAMARIQRKSAELGYGDGETNFTLAMTDLAFRLRRRSLVVVLTEFVDTVTAELMIENLRRLSRRHLVIFVTLRDLGLGELARREPTDGLSLSRSVGADDFVQERDVVSSRLRRQGIHVIDAPPAELSAALLNRYLDVKSRELV